MINKNIVAIVQARTGSTRLPRKVLARVYDKTLIEHLLERVAASQMANLVVLATTQNPADDELVNVAQKSGVEVFRGDENDVLKRYSDAASHFKADIVIRMTGDNPLCDPTLIDRTVQELLDRGCDYCTNTLPPSFPEGLDVEVMRVSALHRAHSNATQSWEREHVTPYIWAQPELFSIHNISAPSQLESLRWTVDVMEDLALIRGVYRHLYPNKRLFVMTDVLTLLEQHPSLALLNSSVPRRESRASCISSAKDWHDDKYRLITQS